MSNLSPEAQLLSLIPKLRGLPDLGIQVNDQLVTNHLFHIGSELVL